MKVTTSQIFKADTTERTVTTIHSQVLERAVLEVADLVDKRNSYWSNLFD
jgi:hypothetical protein